MGTGPHQFQYLANTLTLSYVRGRGKIMHNLKVYPHQDFRYSDAPNYAGIAEPAGYRGFLA